MPPLKKAILVVIIRDEEPNVILGGSQDLDELSTVLDLLFRIRNDSLIVMRDTFDIDSPFYATAENVFQTIENTLLEISEHDEGGDVFVYFSAHGDRVIADPNTNNTGFKEYVCLAQDTVITDENFRALNKTVSDGCFLTLATDVCHSRGLIEAAEEQIGDSVLRMTRNRRANLLARIEGFNLGILLSGCQSYELCEDEVEVPKLGLGGLFTHCLIQELHVCGGLISNSQLIMNVQQRIQDFNRPQHPGLYCWNEVVNRPFLGGHDLEDEDEDQDEDQDEDE